MSMRAGEGSLHFNVGQVVMIRGGELDGEVGSIVGLNQQSAEVKIRSKIAPGDVLTNVRYEYLVPIPADMSPWKTGDQVCVVFENLRPTVIEGVVLETAVFNNPAGSRAFVQWAEGDTEWVDIHLLRPRIVIPEFATPAEADVWAERIRATY
jgi:hypothetical protein